MIRPTLGSTVPLIHRFVASRIFQTGIPLAVLTISLGIMVHLIAGESSSISVDLRTLNPGFILLGVLAVAASNLGGGLFWKNVLASCGADLTLRESIRIWCLATPAKYGLSFVSLYAGRVYLGERAGVPRRALLASIPLELALIVASGVMVLLLLAPFGGYTPVISGSLPGRFATPTLALLIFLALPALVRATVARVPERWAGDRVAMTFPGVRNGLVVALVNWFFLGVASFFLVGAMAPVQITILPVCVFAVALALLSGMVAVTPLGLGVREVVLALVLAQVIPAPVATTVALLHRIVTVAAEILCAVIALVASRALKIGRVQREAGENPGETN